MLMIAFTIMLGVSLATAMLNVMLDVGDKVNRELKTYGANINVIPKEASLMSDLYGADMEFAGSGKYLDESELGNVKTIFWAFNIVDFTPYLNTSANLGNDMDKVRVSGTWFANHLDLPTGESVDTGMINLKRWWNVEGEWASDDGASCMVGSLLAGRAGITPGDIITLTTANAATELTVAGIFTSGSDEDDYIYVPLSVAQSLANNPGKVSNVEVSALTTPDNELSRRAAQDPKSLSIKEWETWYCTAYVSAICYQIDEVLTDSVSKPIRQVAESEGAILDKTKLLMFLITVISMVGAALGISNLVTANVMERSREIGLLKALGARNFPISVLILTEILIAGLIGCVAGYFAGTGFAQIIGHTVFGTGVDIKPLVIPIAALMVACVTLIGSIPSIRLLLSLKPAEVLHGR
jgi:putative ABC transport system permease protein